ncbi:ABC transporter substrate-binding protein [Candidatus Poriferisodalis sp.]|uniref:ABC transporter substrate-binding protein n=1 Tax=Candidatus Poriferisodalis sp. TaxID=3101277 RepID=UPI003AF87EB8
MDFPSIELPPPLLAFFCYARHDDDNESGRVSQLRGRIEGEVRAVSGRDFRIWQDTADLRIGSSFDLEIGSVLDSADALLVLVTPSLLTSTYCRREIARFRSLRQHEGAPPPIFPILYIDAFGPHIEHDAVAGYLRSIQYADWTELRHEDPDSSGYRRSVTRLANDINTALGAAGESAIGSRIPAAQSGSAALRTNSPTSVAPASGAASEPLTIDGVLQAAAVRRDEIVSLLSAGIENGAYGIKNDTLFGPSAFKADLRSRPDSWSNTSGIAGAEIRIGYTTAMSGNLAAYGLIADGFKNYLDWVNLNDPIVVDGRPREIGLVVRDDGYAAVRTIALVDRLIQADNVFSILTLGSPNTLAVYDKINRACIPHPFVMSGHPAWGDPVNHPWTTGLQMSYSTEAILWGEWIKRNMGSELPVRVAAAVTDNDFGLAYEQAFDRWAAMNPEIVAEFIPVRHDPAAATLLPEMEIIRRLSPDVHISMTAGNPCLLAVQEAHASGLTHDIRARGGALFTSSVGKGVAAYMAPAGMAGDGWLIVGGGTKDCTDPAYSAEPFIEFVNSNLRSAGLDANLSLYGVGYVYAFPYVEALRVAADLPGGLTRTNFILAVRALDIDHPMLMDGIKFRLDGNADPFPIEGSDISRYDARTRAWQTIGDTIDVAGDTQSCRWDPHHGGCR